MMNRRNFFGTVGALIAGAVMGKSAEGATVHPRQPPSVSPWLYSSDGVRWEVVNRLPIEDVIVTHQKRIEGEFAMAGKYFYVKLPDGNWRRIHALGW